MDNNNMKGNYVKPSKRTIIDRILRRKKPFTFYAKANWKKRLKFKANKLKLNIDIKESQNIINLVHIADNGDIYLLPSYQSLRTLNYKADKRYKKKFSFAERIAVHFYDGRVEEGVLCDSFSPTNYKIIPKLGKDAIHSKREFENAYDTFENDLIRTSTFNFSDSQKKTMALMLIAGIGLGVLLSEYIF